MFTMKALFIRALLALCLIGAVPAALAGPTYQVTIKTANLPANLPAASMLDLQFLGLGGAEPAFAYLSNFSGDLDVLSLDNASGDLASGFTIGNNTGLNSVLFQLLSASTIRFDVRFETGAAGDGTTFSAALLDEFFGNLGGDFPLLEIDLMPGAPDELRVTAGLAEANAVPEPADWALVMTGLLLIGAMRRMQKRS
jgi:hypothetical protein